MRFTSSALLGSAAMALGVVGNASAAIFTYSYTIPAPVTIGTVDTYFGTVFSSTPYASVTSVGWSGLTATTVGTTWGSDLFVGVQTTEGIVGSTPFTNNNAGPAGPATTTLTAPPATFFLPASGQFQFGAVNTFATGTPGSTLDAGTLSVTIDDSVVFTPPPAPASTATIVGGSLTSTLAAGEVDWYSFSFGGGNLTLDTEGSTISGTNDTELGLYNSIGTLVATDDDGGTGNLSLLNLTGLPADTYYLAVGSFNTAFAGSFGATSTSVATGTYNINGLTVVPEPTSLALLGMGVIGLTARRRRA